MPRHRALLAGIGVLGLLAALATEARAQTKPPTVWRPAHSSNFTYSTLGRGIRYVIIHTVEGSALGAVSWFQNPASNVSAHYTVSYGGTIYQSLADKDIGWHAGNWTYNKHSIGIEHEGYAHRNYWTDAEYRASARLTRWICLTYGVPMDRQHIIGHKEVPYATHTDPGPYFNWSYYMSLVRDGSTAPPPPPAATSQAMQCTAGALNVRNGPSTGYSIKGLIYNGQRYVSTATSGGWHKIYYANNTGWCYGGYLKRVTGVTGVRINTAVLNVRYGPSTGYSIRGRTSMGQEYVRISTSGSWFKIYWGGGAYWVHGGYTRTFGL